MKNAIIFEFRNIRRVSIEAKTNNKGKGLLRSKYANDFKKEWNGQNVQTVRA